MGKGNGPSGSATQGSGVAKRLFVVGLFLFGGARAWVALASSGHPPRSAGETAPKRSPTASESDEPAPKTDLVKPAQKPAPEIEAQYNSFIGNRAPPSSGVELGVERTPDGRHYQITEVDPKGPCAGKYQPGEILDKFPEPCTGSSDPNESQPTTSEGAAKAPSSH